MLWLSVRPPEYSASLDNVHDFFGDFPQLVNREMVELIRTGADGYIECVSSEGLPQKLYNRHTGKPTAIRKRQDLGGTRKAFNDYYPSPEMHMLAAKMLMACIDSNGELRPVKAKTEKKAAIEKVVPLLPRLKQKSSYYLLKIRDRV